MAPDKLNVCYDLLYNSSDKYILIGEYYNPKPVEVLYRGNKKSFLSETLQVRCLKNFLI